MPVTLLAAMIETSRVSGRIAALQVGRIDQPVAADRQLGHRHAQPLQLPATSQDGRMLDGAGDQMGAGKSGRQQHALQGQVVGLGAAAGEDDFAGLGAEQVGHLCPRPIHRLAGLPPLGVEARRIAPKLVEIRPHGLQHPRIGRRGGGVVEVDALRHGYSPR